jgi:cytochrome c oxidase accessory protein FixG
VEKLAQWVQQSPWQHPAGFLVMLATTGLMMFDFCYFREQTCILACPYGRFQSVLLDRNSLIIGYDTARGEPRGKMRSQRSAAGLGTGADAGGLSLPILSNGNARSGQSTGDCVDCRMCVTTCPTGIDIRDGLQMECIGCAQCIDACDAVMDRLGRARGLIRYSSQAAIAGESSRLIRPRVIVYPLVLVVIAGLFAMAFLGQSAADVTVLRGLGRPFTELEGGQIANPIRVKIVNRQEQAASYTLRVDGYDGISVQAEENPVVVGPGESRTSPAMVIAPIAAFEHGRCDVTLHISDDAGFQEAVAYRLMGPARASGANGARIDEMDEVESDLSGDDQ